MIKKHFIFTLIYAFTFLVVLASMYFNMVMVSNIAKPCISVELIVFLCLSTKLSGRFHQRLFTGLIFALTGITLLMLTPYHRSYELYGQAAFIICHIFYISAFYLDFRSAQELDKRGAKIAITTCAVVFTAFYLCLRPYLPVVKLPVLLCVFIAALLMMMAAFRNQRVNPLSFRLIMAGTACFICTDALYAYIHFVNGFYLSSLLLSAAYMIAQYLIVTGGAERVLIHHQTPE